MYKFGNCQVNKTFLMISCFWISPAIFWRNNIMLLFSFQKWVRLIICKFLFLEKMQTQSATSKAGLIGGTVTAAVLLILITPVALFLIYRRWIWLTLKRLFRFLNSYIHKVYIRNYLSFYFFNICLQLYLILWDRTTNSYGIKAYKTTTIK